MYKRALTSSLTEAHLGGRGYHFARGINDKHQTNILFCTPELKKKKKVHLQHCPVSPFPTHSLLKDQVFLPVVPQELTALFTMFIGQFSVDTSFDLAAFEIVVQSFLLKDFVLVNIPLVELLIHWCFSFSFAGCS